MDNLFEPDSNEKVIDKKKSVFKSLPVFLSTRKRTRDCMMKNDTYDSFVNKLLDVYEKVQCGEYVLKSTTTVDG